MKTQAVAYSDVSSQFTSSGRLMSYNEEIVSSEVGGRLSKGDVDFKTGISFRKEDILAKVTNNEFRLSVKAQKSQFLQSVANILAEIKIDYPVNYEQWNQYFESITLDSPLPTLPEINNKKERIFLATRDILNTYYSIKSNEEQFNCSIYRHF